MTDSVDIDLQSPFCVGDWSVDPDSGRLHKQGAEIKLEPKVMRVLQYLAKHQGKVVSREDLEKEVWAGTIVGYDAIASSVIKLRKALGDNARNPEYIETIPKKGYRLVAKVIGPSPDVVGITSPKSVEGGTEMETVEAADTRRPQPLRPKNRSAILLSAGLFAALGIGLALTFNESGSKTEPHDQQAPGITANRPSIVVLPFKNLSNDAKQEYFSDGITDDLITDLSRISGLSTIARRSAYSYKQRSGFIDAIASELGVQYVVEGSVQRNNDNLRVNVQLVDTVSGSNLWAERFERTTDDLFKVQDDIRRNIINALSVTLTEQEKQREQRRYTSNFEAYDYFLQGQSALVRRASAGDNNLARELMEKAIALDENFARALAALALIHADAFRFNWTEHPEQTRQLALETGKRAIDLDPQLPQAYWILGYIYLFLFDDHQRAIEMGEQTLVLDPRNADAYTLLGVTHVFNSNPEKAKALMEHLMKMYPRYPSQVPSILAIANLLLARYDEALSASDETLLINPTRVQGNVYRTLILYRMGQTEDAEWQADQLLSLHPDFDANMWAERQPFSDKSVLEKMLSDLQQVGLN